MTGRVRPLGLKTLSRGVVNQRVGIIRRAFRWAEGEGLVPEGKYEHLRSLSNLKSGRSEARDTDPVEAPPRLGPRRWRRPRSA